MGGVARRATKIHEVRSQGIPTIVIDGGGFSGLTDPQGVLKLDTMLVAFVQMGYDALGFTAPELHMQTEHPDTLEKLAASAIPLVTLNVRYRGEAIARKPLIIERDGVKVAVFALLFPESIREPLSKDWEISAPGTMIDETLAQTREDSDLVVAILYGRQDEVRSFVIAHQGMDVVIEANNPTQSYQPLKIGDTMCVSAGTQGKYLGRIDAVSNERVWGFDAQLVGLTKEIPEDQQLVATYQRYQTRVAELAVQKEHDAATRLAGKYPPKPLTADCQRCHDEIYQKWKQTRHARAILSLLKKNEHRNPECLPCHVVGYMEGGFISLEKTLQYAGVQCVSCHGDMDGHVAFHSGAATTEKMKPLEVTPQVCVRCHNPQNDDNFLFERDKILVHH